MFSEQLRVGRPAPDYGRSSGDHVVAILPGGPANMAMTKWVLEQENSKVRRFASRNCRCWQNCCANVE